MKNKKLDQILQKLESIEKRIDVLEKARPNQSFIVPTDTKPYIQREGTGYWPDYSTKLWC